MRIRPYSRAGTRRDPGRWLTSNAIASKTLVTDEMQRDAMVAGSAPRIPWDDFLNNFQWERGEHVGLVGPTGQGKTTLLYHLQFLHPFTVLFGTKPDDASLDVFLDAGFVRMERWHSVDARQIPKRLIWPKPSSLSELVPLQKRVFGDAIEAIYSERNWDLILDEGYYIDEVLKMGSILRLLYTQVRALKISILLATQRPAWVPVEVYDQSTHLFFWRDNDARNLRRLQEVSLIHSAAIKEIVPNLEKYQVLYLNTRTGEMLRTRCPKVS